ncbi:TPA: MBL fold metallo-hydrolase [Candidatus Bathyarchaeota archaeon]|nr:MBL fold metallo-hydrolase [Candidatus Bathyarchaeota archaeon]
MIIKTFVAGPLETNCYLIFFKKHGEALILDPAVKIQEFDRIIRFIISLDLKVKYIINTHGHFDHIMGNRIVKDGTGAKILIHRDDSDMLTNPEKNLSKMIGLTVTSPKADMLLEDDEIIRVDQEKIRVIHTPGHTRGSISIFTKGSIFTGDTLFAGSVGRTDLPGASLRNLAFSLRKLMNLPKNTRIYPGHGPSSSIASEKKSNFYIKALLHGADKFLRPTKVSSLNNEEENSA